MNYQLLSKTKPKAKKEYHCIWCPEKILKGDIHVKEAGTYDGFFSRRWHNECWEASQKYFSENPCECEIYPHECKRGTSEQNINTVYYCRECRKEITSNEKMCELNGGTYHSTCVEAIVDLAIKALEKQRSELKNEHLKRDEYNKLSFWKKLSILIKSYVNITSK